MGSKRIKERRKSNAKYKRLSIQRKTSKKLMERYIELYKIEKVISKNAVKLKLPAFMRIYLVVNISRIEKYKKPVRK